MVNLYALAAFVAVIPQFAYSALLSDSTYRILTPEGLAITLPQPNAPCIIASSQGEEREQVWTVRSVPGDDDFVELENDEHRGYYAVYESAQPHKLIKGANSQPSRFALRRAEVPGEFYIVAKGDPDSGPLIVGPTSSDPNSEVELSLDLSSWVFEPVVE
nr:RcOsp5 [Ceratobasidium cereale]